MWCIDTVLRTSDNEAVSSVVSSIVSSVVSSTVSTWEMSAYDTLDTVSSDDQPVKHVWTVEDWCRASPAPRISKIVQIRFEIWTRHSVSFLLLLRFPLNENDELMTYNIAFLLILSLKHTMQHNIIWKLFAAYHGYNSKLNFHLPVLYSNPMYWRLIILGEGSLSCSMNYLLHNCWLLRVVSPVLSSYNSYICWGRVAFKYCSLSGARVLHGNNSSITTSWFTNDF